MLKDIYYRGEDLKYVICESFFYPFVWNFQKPPYICRYIFHSIRYKVNKNRLEYGGTPFFMPLRF